MVDTLNFSIPVLLFVWTNMLSIPTKLLLIFSWLASSYTFQSGPNGLSAHYRCRLLRMSEHVDQQEVSNLISNGKYADACEQLKRNPLIPLSREDARIMLNNIGQLYPSNLVDAESVQKAVRMRRSLLFAMQKF